MKVIPKMPTELHDFLSLPYGELEELNLAAKAQRHARVDKHTLQEERLKYLSDEKLAPNNSNETPSTVHRWSNAHESVRV